MSEEQNNEEQEIIVETEEVQAEEKLESETKVDVAPVEEEQPKEKEDELESYSKGVQNRIKKLTEKYRQEERDKAEAVRLSQQLMEENKKLKSRVQNLDTGYLNEYGNRLQSQEITAKNMYKQAHEVGDTDKMLEAQELIAKIAVEKQRFASAKAKSDNSKVQVQKAPQQQPVVQQQQQPPKPDPRAEDWASKNEWFGQDRVMTTGAFAIHQQLVEEEGFDPASDEYYTELDSRIRNEFPHKFQSAKKSSGGSQVASATASASRSNKQGRRSVKLTHSQVAIAKKLGVPLEEYAKYVKD